MKATAINLPNRTDRLAHITAEFQAHPQFEVTIREPEPCEPPNVSLCQTFRKIIEENRHEPYILICEDDHVFTPDFNFEKFQKSISEADKLNADVVLGGVSAFTHPVFATGNLCWVGLFNATQFTVLFQRFYDALLTTKFRHRDCIDYKISALSRRKLVCYPFVSVQKNFVYSDVTPNNNGRNIEKAFKSTEKILTDLKTINKKQ